jgi:hypothetical protein
MAHIEFTNNYEDLSTENGFQFKFICESCNNGYLSSWRANKVGIAGSLLRGAGQIFGGVLGTAARGSYEIQKAIGGAGHDSAIEEAVTEIKPLFTQCKHCGHYVCREVCWNTERSLCTHCAPILQREMAAQQAQIAVQQAAEKLRQRDQTEGINFDATTVVNCPTCGVEATGGKFCHACGGSLAPKAECSRCGTKMAPGAKFCPECGQPHA